MSVHPMVLKVEKRDAQVRNVHRKSVKDGYVAGILYNAAKNQPIRIPRVDFVKAFAKAHSNTVFQLELDGQKRQAYIKSYQEALDKNSTLIHVDFFEIEPGTKIKISVPVRVTGQSKGVIQGGILEYLASTVNVKCKPEHIPQEIVVDVTNLDIGDHFKVRDLKLGAEVEIVDADVKSIVSVISTAKRDSKATEAAAAPVAAAAPAADAKAAPAKAGDAKAAPAAAAKTAKK